MSIDICVPVSGCIDVCSVLRLFPLVPPSHLRAPRCSDESDPTSCASTGPGWLIKNANVSRWVFDAGPRTTKPAKVTKGLCNPLFGPDAGGHPAESPDSHNQSCQGRLTQVC